jgi:hypothetical protein
MVLRDRRQRDLSPWPTIKSGERGNAVIVPTVTESMATWELWKAVASSNHFGGEQPAASAEGGRNGSDPATHRESGESEKNPRE